ncbi:MAG TPA: hypothetical protein VGQ26_17690 [Streptosporangiaceae bacterium]|nr:hypothetical protein [Streptosporangiaceae bacterium]
MIKLVTISLVAVAVVLSAAACGGSGRAASGPSGPPASPRPGSAAKLIIITPANGEVIHARTVRVKVRLTGADTENPATPLALPGYVHLYLDSKIISIAPVASNDSVTKQTIGHVKPGRHTLKIEFVGPTHLPFRPRVIAAVTFAVRG